MNLKLSFNWKAQKWALAYCLVATLGACCYGYDTFYYNGVLGMKSFIREYGEKTVDGPYELATTFLSVSASILYVGELLGSLFAGLINDRFGRKAVFLTASVCIIIGCVILICSFGIHGLFYAGRVLVGLGIGQFTATCLMYVADVAPVSIRGPALMMFQFMQSVAQLLGALVNKGAKTIDGSPSYQLPMGIEILLPLTMLICLPFIPESPTSSVYIGKPEKARKALEKINRGVTEYNPEGDLDRIEEQVGREREEQLQSSWSSLLKSPAERRKLIFACGAMAAQQVCGIQFWYSYGVLFAQSIGVGQPFTINIIIAVVQIMTVGTSVMFGNKLKRRPNLLICTVGMILSLVAVGGLGTTGHNGDFSRGIGIGIVVFAFLNIVFYNFSIGPLSFTIAGEMAVGRNRNKITAASMATFFFSLWLMVFTSPYLYYKAHLGPMLGFIYAGTSLLTLAYVWFCVGETAGRTNAELEYFFLNRVPVREWSIHVFSKSESSASSFSDTRTMSDSDQCSFVEHYPVEKV